MFKNLVYISIEEIFDCARILYSSIWYRSRADTEQILQSPLPPPSPLFDAGNTVCGAFIKGVERARVCVCVKVDGVFAIYSALVERCDTVNLYTDINKMISI